jgi:hypothetical protein
LSGQPPTAELPPCYYTPSQLRPFFGKGWSTRRVRRWLDRAGVLEMRHGTPITTAERLATAFPELYRRLLMTTS